jgi:hypothetical protein
MEDADAALSEELQAAGVGLRYAWREKWTPIMTCSLARI